MLVFNCKTRKWQEAEIQEISAEELKALEDAIEAAVKEQMAAEAKRPLTMEEVVRLTIAKTINSITVEDETALRMMEYYPAPEAASYAAGDRIQYNGKLYKCLQAHTAQADWTPDATPALWVVVSIDEYPEWVQPTGAHDAYNTGDKVSYHGKHYICTADANIYAPDVYGWEET